MVDGLVDGVVELAVVSSYHAPGSFAASRDVRELRRLDAPAPA
jgi:hypothetical protein